MVGRASGFTYLAVLFATAILTAGAGLSIEAWHTTARREREAELMHVGAQYRRAIMLYYESSPDGRPRYPRELKDLLKDERYPSTRRHLRKLFPDPITGAEWVLMKAPDGGVMGIHSPSRDAPLRITTPGATYADWKFAYRPVVPAPRVPPKPKPGPATAAN